MTAIESVRLDSNRICHIGDPIDTGGHGRVHEATCEGKRYAIKLVERRPGADQESLIADEVYGITNVIPVLDKGSTPSHWALLMPRAELSLGRYIEKFAKGPAPEDHVLPILVDIARALDGVSKIPTVHYEGIGIVHRDLKPANVLRWKGAWHLTDFGIARYAEKDTDPHSRGHLGTREYKAPEQWINERATAQADIYAFGVMAFELLAGKRPFDGPHLPRKTIRDDPPTLMGVAPSLAAIVGMCLYKNPADRPTPENLLRLLENMPPVADRKSGFTALQQANLEATARHGQEIRDQFVKHGLQAEGERLRTRVFAYESANTEHHVDQRQAAAYRDIYAISARVKETIVRHAPACEEVETASGWSLQIGSATITFSNPVESREVVISGSSPFKTIAYCEIRVAQMGKDGRAHSLWFCDAKHEGDFYWFETAFVRGNRSRPYSPFALSPGSGEAIAALTSRPGSGDCDVAWSFTSLSSGNLYAFIDRWANWLALASRGGLVAKYTHPLEAAHSWRGAISEPKAYDQARHNAPMPSKQGRTLSLSWRTILRFTLFPLLVTAGVIGLYQIKDNSADSLARTAGLKCYVAFGASPGDAEKSNNPFPCDKIPRDRVGRQYMWVFAELQGLTFSAAKADNIVLKCSESARSLSDSSLDMANPNNDLQAAISWNFNRSANELPARLTCQIFEGANSLRTESFDLRTDSAG